MTRCLDSRYQFFANSNDCCNLSGAEKIKLPISGSLSNCSKERGLTNEATSANIHINDPENYQTSIVANTPSSRGITFTPTKTSLNDQNAGEHQNNTPSSIKKTDNRLKQQNHHVNQTSLHVYALHKE